MQRIAAIISLIANALVIVAVYAWIVEGDEDMIPLLIAAVPTIYLILSAKLYSSKSYMSSGLRELEEQNEILKKRIEQQELKSKLKSLT